MKFTVVVCAILVSACIGYEMKEERGLGSLRSVFDKCVTDHQCKPFEFCDHTGVNPVGTCHAGREAKQACVFDRHCKSKVCHNLQCAYRRPVKDGPCEKDEHRECIPTQYCSHKTNVYKCNDRLCHGYCTKDAHCLSDKCTLFRCKRPETGC